MTTPKRFEFKPTPQGRSWQETRRQLAVYEHQMRLYREGFANPPQQIALDEYHAQVNYPELETEALARYARADAEYTMTWWRQNAGEPVLVNKLRGRANQTLFSLNDLIHPETIQAMTMNVPGCGCVR